MMRTLLTCVLLLATLSGCALTKRPLFGRKADETLERSISIARLTERHGNVQQARTMYTRLASEHPNHPVPHHRLGVLAAKAGNLEEAMQHFSRARQTGDNSAELLCDIGYLHYLQNNYAAAEEQLRAAIAAEPEHKRAHNTLGLVLAEEGRFNEALAAFRRAVNEAEALANLAYVQIQLGALQEAEANYHRALALNQSLKPAAEGLMHIAAIQGKLKPVQPLDSQEAIVRAKRARSAPNQEQPGSVTTEQDAQLAGYRDANTDTGAAPTAGTEPLLESERAVVRQASHQRTPSAVDQPLYDPRVGTTSRQINVASADKTAVPANSKGTEAAPQAPGSAREAAANLMPSRNPTWSPYQSAPTLIP